jgi:hypothetical protein
MRNTWRRKPTLLNQNDLDWFAARLSIAVYDVNRITPEMSAYELQSALKDITGSEQLTISYAQNGNQLIHIGDRTVEVGPMASNDEIRTALLNPFIPTANTKVKMASPLQGIGQKLAKLKHDAAFDAEKLGSRIDAVAARKDAAVAKANGGLDVTERDIADVEAFAADIEQATNT